MVRHLPPAHHRARRKNGQTAAGAIWLDAGRTSPYEFYQYWINTDDRDVCKFLALFTFLPLPEVERLGAGEGAELNSAKEVLAFEATSLCHGEAAAAEARTAARAAFGSGGDFSAMPTTTLALARLEQGVGLLDLFVETGLTPSKGEARRLVQQGGAYVNDTVISDAQAKVTAGDLKDGAVLLRAGKKKYHRVVVG